MEKREERRKSDRRKGRDRRTGKFDEIYKKLVAEGIFQDSRKGERRVGEGRSGLPRPTIEEKYMFYIVGIDKTNMKRQKAGLELIPKLTFEEWSRNV